MKDDSISASSKIKELFDLHRSGILSNEEYHNQLKSWVLSQLKISPAEKSEVVKGPFKITRKYIRPSSGKLTKDESELLRSVIIGRDEDLPTKEKVEKVLWTLLN
jgi:hypothetical protein